MSYSKYFKITTARFANVAFSLTDPRKVSKVVQSEYGFHIIQLIDKRGDKVKVRHILPFCKQNLIMHKTDGKNRRFSSF